MWQLIAILFASASTLLLLHASQEVGDSIRRKSQEEYFAKEMALSWVSFGRALERYSEDYGGSLENGDTIVTCADLKNGGYLQDSFSCTDVFGRQLSGLISKPVGAVQSVIVYPATPADPELYMKLGIREGLGQRAFIFRTAQNLKKLSPEYELVALRVREGTFEELFSYTTDSIGEYVAGSVPAQKTPGYEYVPLLFVKRAKGVGYWVWSVQETSTGITFTSDGFSSVCPTASALPRKPKNAWSFVPQSRADWNWAGSPTGSVMSTYICIPATRDTVLKNPSASIPSLSIPIDSSLITNKRDAEGDYVARAGACGGNPYFGVVEINVGARTYTVFGWQNMCAYVCSSSGTCYPSSLWTVLLFVEGKAPSTFCVDLVPGFVDYCYNVDTLLSEAGGSREEVSFKE